MGPWTLGDLRLLPRGPGVLDQWRVKDTLETVLGPVPVEIRTPLDALPTPEQLARAHELARFAHGHPEEIRDVLEGHYRWARRQGWLRLWTGPPDLDREGVMDHVREPLLAVTEYGEMLLRVRTTWAPDPGLRLTVAWDRIAHLDGVPFVLDPEGVLQRVTPQASQ